MTGLGSSDVGISLGAVFTLLFITLGPLKLLGPFAQLTHGVDDSTVRKIASRAFLIALAAVVLGGFAGRELMLNWNISVPGMELAGGVIFFLVGLRIVMQQYQPDHASLGPLPAQPLAAAMRFTFPNVVTPYGIAALIVLLANSRTDSTRTVAILALVVGIMLLNLLAMRYARQIMAGFTVIVLQVLGAVLGVLQVALAVEMLLRGLRGLGLVAS